MRKIKNFVKVHFVLSWFLASVLFALIIHILYCFDAPNKYFEAKWDAGEILAYASTVILGLVAFYQNNCQKRENDIAQERLENIAVKSNEINIKSRVIDYQTNRLQTVKKAIALFFHACNPQALVAELFENLSSEELFKAKLDVQEENIDKTFNSLSRLLQVDYTVKFNDEHPFKIAFTNYYLCAKNFINVSREPNSTANDIEKQGDRLVAYRKNFMQESERYLITEEEKLRKLLFEDLTIEEIRKMFIEYNLGNDSVK